MGTLSANSAGTALMSTNANYPWNHNRRLFPVNFSEMYYQINGGSTRFPLNTKLMNSSAFHSIALNEQLLRSIFGDGLNFNNQYQKLLTESMYYPLPFERELGG